MRANVFFPSVLGSLVSVNVLANCGGGSGGKQEFSTFSRSFSTVLDGMANGLDYPLLLSANPVSSHSRPPPSPLFLLPLHKHLHALPLSLAPSLSHHLTRAQIGGQVYYYYTKP
jgi:hypothetical protein